MQGRDPSAARRRATLSHMERIGIRELRQNASVYLRRVESGESFEVADRGRPIAVLTPIRKAGRDQLIANGRLRVADGDPSRLGRPIPRIPGMESPTTVLAELREE